MVSIQRSLDGHSFSIPALSDIPAGYDPVQVEVLLPHTMLIPAELFDEEHATELLAANGMPLTADECAVCCGREEQYVAVAAISSEALRLVKARFTTPLLRMPREVSKTVWMCRRAELLYIKVYDGSGVLQLAEVVPAETDEDLVYFFERLNGCFPLAEFGLHITGDAPKAARKLLGKRFKQAICE